MVEKEDVTNVERTPMSTARTLRHLPPSRRWSSSPNMGRKRWQATTASSNLHRLQAARGCAYRPGTRASATACAQSPASAIDVGGASVEKLAPRTIRGVRAVLRAALSDAIRWRLVARNAAALSHAPRVSRPSWKFFLQNKRKLWKRCRREHLQRE